MNMKRKLIFASLLLGGLFINAQAQDNSSGDKSIRIEGRARSITTSEDALRGRVYGLDDYATMNRSSLNLSKRFQGETISSDAEFEVSKDAKGINLNLGGSCKKGEIEITISLPGGDTYKNQKITTAADVHWSATISFKEEDGKKYVGTWKLKVKTNNTEGEYNLNISSR
jgi:hypothetical protein